MRPVVRSFLATLMISSFLLVSTALPARAACVGVSNTFYGVDTQNSSMFEYGAEADNILVTGLEPCNQTRTLYVWRDGNDWVEIGWYRDGTNQSLSNCTNSTAPRVFVYQLRNGFISCKPNTAILTGGENYSFRVRNPEHNFSFNFYWGAGTIPGTALGSYMTDHSRGAAIMTTEAHQPGDNLRAHFTGVKSLGDSLWHNLPTPLKLEHGVGQAPYIVCSYGTTYLHVEPSGSC